MINSYILVQTEPGMSDDVAERAADVQGVVSADVVLSGPYDVIIHALAENIDDLGNTVSRDIHQISGLTRVIVLVMK
jgi:DNA-binding Lrp family transcriptional regulator